MTWVLRILWFLVGNHLKVRLLKGIKQQGLVAYLRLLQGSRRFLILALVAFLALQLMLISGVGLLVTAFMIWEFDFRTKMEILGAIFAALFFFPLFGLAYVLSENVWFQASGAAKLIEDMRASSTSAPESPPQKT